jgi:hypothetical protein
MEPMVWVRLGSTKVTVCRFGFGSATIEAFCAIWCEAAQSLRALTATKTQVATTRPVEPLRNHVDAVAIWLLGPISVLILLHLR